MTCIVLEKIKKFYEAKEIAILKLKKVHNLVVIDFYCF